jgi:hypothetical protein
MRLSSGCQASDFKHGGRTRTTERHGAPRRKASMSLVEALQPLTVPDGVATANLGALSGPLSASVIKLKNESTNRAICTFPHAGKPRTFNSVDHEAKPGHDTSTKCGRPNALHRSNVVQLFSRRLIHQPAKRSAIPVSMTAIKAPGSTRDSVPVRQRATAVGLRVSRKYSSRAT